MRNNNNQKSPVVEPIEIELPSKFAVIELPNSTVEATIMITAYHNGELVEGQMKMDMQAVQTAFHKADEGYIDEDMQFTLTEEGRRYCEELIKGEGLI